ncbi:branched-chain amino acid ABC transporter permease [Rhodobacter sp. 24-YEA-8]|uniref:branched-chain amino acid ABC transporter permease n=1 Tax=Rhodobacter sp. 24-YEA-8 TaxID=1884310 RepID=UPI0008949F81|nr:branched-chain amino acid ABC transporter permease [Rhodobacter sp. 24-YEA-8]SEB88387.1 amino acid/amide ABC transporter membrane protein 1, HAAT family [Rhodobacter sp. 24-YEA-8]
MDILNAFVAFANFILVPGLTYGSQLALGALGVSLVFAVLRFSNFAHGDTMALGTVMAILFTWMLQSWGVSAGPLPTALIALPFAIIATSALVLGSDIVVYRFYRRAKAKPIILMIASIGVMFVMNGLVRMILGTREIQFADGERFLLPPATFRAATGLAEPLAIRTSQAVSVIVAVICVVALFWFLNRTRTGKSMRAFSDNEDLALLSGINPDRVVTVTWIIAAALATIAGTLYGLDKNYRVFVYFGMLLPIFASAIVGGLGSPIGAIIGGFVIAFSEILITNAWSKILGYLMPEGWLGDGLYQALSTDYKVAVSFVILIIVLLVKPNGIMGSK